VSNTTNTNGNTEQSEKPKATLCVADLEMRDYFAAKAMAAFLTAAGINKAGVPGTNNFEFIIAEKAYMLADAMLRARAIGED
jgi:hypothetical protein